MTSFYLFDWISFTTRSHNIKELEELLGLSGVHWEEGKGSKGYQDRLWYENISLHYNGTNEMGIWCEMTGQGCRAFESYGHGSYESLFTTLLDPDEDINITRIDIAFDDHDGLLDLNKLLEDTQKQNYISAFKHYMITLGSKGTTIEHGRKGSHTMIRIYDKAAEKGYKDGRHWVRVELQLRQERARAFIERYMEDNRAISRTFRGVVFNYLRYIKPSKTDTNLRRAPIAKYWEKFINGADKIKLYRKPGVEYNLENLENYVINMAGTATKAYIEIMGITQYLSSIHSSDYTNPKYERLKAKYRNHHPTALQEFMMKTPEVEELLYIIDEHQGKIEDYDEEY